MVAFKRIHRDDVNSVWVFASTFLEKGIAYSDGEWTLSDLQMACSNGFNDLWIALDEDHCMVAAFTTHFVQYPQYRVLEGGFSGSIPNINIWPEAHEFLKGWAKENGCARFRIVGRPGWTKALKKVGFSLDSVIMGVWTT